MPNLDVIRQQPIVPYPINSIRWDNCLVYGRPASEKTELMRLIAEQAASRYGPDIMAARNVGHYMDRFLSMPVFDKKPIQLFLFDDLTGIRLKPQQITSWFELRHSMYDKVGSTGLLFTMLATHEYFSIPKYLRQGISCLFVKSLPNPANTYDYAWLKRVIGEDGLAFLSKMEYAKMFNSIERHFAVFKFLDITGYVETPMATKDFLQGWKYWKGSP
jgi:hypothetical protein